MIIRCLDNYRLLYASFKSNFDSLSFGNVFSRALIMWYFFFQDPLTIVREECAKIEQCAKALERLEQCNTRVSSRSQTLEECTEELFDFLEARDHCVSWF